LRQVSQSGRRLWRRSPLRRRFNCPWSASTRLLAYRSVRCQADGASASSTRGVHRGLVGDDLHGRDLGRADGAFEEPASRVDVPPPTNTLMTSPNWSTAPVHVPPLTGDLHLRLVGIPPMPDGMSARPRGVRQQRREAPYPAVDRDVVHQGGLGNAGTPASWHGASVCRIRLDALDATDPSPLDHSLLRRTRSSTDTTGILAPRLGCPPPEHRAGVPDMVHRFPSVT
jgi:hypothetical protein